MRRLTPFLANLAVAGVFRLVLPVTLAVGGERYLYYTMSLFFPYAKCPSYQCFRFLPPLIPSLLPFEVIDAFIVTGFVCQVLAGTLLWHVAGRMTGSRRVALLTTAWFWAIWGPVPTLRDPLLIADPVQALWLMAALLLLLDRRYWAALPVVVTGAGVKESVVLAPMIYAAYLVLAGEDIRKDARWLAVLIALPILAWVLVRRYLVGAFEYALPGDSAYLSHPYLYGLWLRELGEWPRNVAIAALYVFAGFGSAWILGALGFLYADRRQRALSVAAVPAMLFLALYQEPHRAVASFPFVLLIPAAIFAEPLPAPLVAALLAVNAAFTVRMSATVSWLPRAPVLFVLLMGLTLACVYLRFARPQTQPRAVAARRAAPAGGRLTATAVVALAIVLIVVVGRDFVSAHAMTTTRVAPPPSAVIADDDSGTPGLAVSPDGDRIVFVGADSSEGRRLWIRPTRSESSESVPGTEGSSAPFWSPDGRFIGFFAHDRLKTIDVSTRTVRALADAPDAHGGAWSRNGVIVFAAGADGSLQQVKAAGGDAAVVAVAPEHTSYRWPAFLPDGEHFLFVERSADAAEDALRVGSIGSRASQRVLNDAYAPTYAEPGVVFFGRWGYLFAQPFDTRRLAFFAPAILVTEHVGTARGFSRAAVSASTNVLAFATTTSESLFRAAGRGRLRWHDRGGQLIGDVQDVTAAAGMQLSPDGRSVALYRAGFNGAWLWDVAKGSPTPFLPGRILRAVPIWSPDGTRIAFAERRAGPEDWQIHIVSAVDTTKGTTLDAPADATPIGWSPDGRVLLYLADGREQGDLWALTLGDGAKPVPLAPGSARAAQAQFSPDGRFVAYVAADRGSRDVYVQPYPPTGHKWIVSSDGGDQPRWRSDGGELIYISQNRFVMAVDVKTRPAFAAGVPRRLFATRLPQAERGVFQYAMSPDARHFLIDTITDAEPSAPVKVVANWRGALALVDSR